MGLPQTSFHRKSQEADNDIPRELRFHHTQSPAKLRCIETAKDKEEKQQLPVVATQQEQLWFLVVCSEDKSSTFHHWMNQGTAQIL